MRRCAWISGAFRRSRKATKWWVRAKASGANQQKIDETERQAKQFKQMYDNPAINVALTLTEVFPIGLVVTLLSAGILRRKADSPKH
jgi:hypothetical protein